MGVFIGQWGKILPSGNIGCEVFLGGKGIHKYVDTRYVCMLVVIKREWIQQFILKSSLVYFS